MIPTFHFVEIETADQESRKAADRENSSRAAVVEVQQQSHGVGQYRLAKAVIFPVIFRSEPHFTFGSAVMKGPSTKLFHDPRGSSGVWGWKRNKAGQYTGAMCWLRVDCEQRSGGTGQAYTTALRGTDLSRVIVRHFMTFSAIAVKKLPTSSLTAALAARQVGL